MRRNAYRHGARSALWVPPHRQYVPGQSNVSPHQHGRLPWSDSAEMPFHDERHACPKWVRVLCWCEHSTVLVPFAVFERGMTAPCERAECVRFDVEICDEERGDSRLSG